MERELGREAPEPEPDPEAMAEDVKAMTVTYGPEDAEVSVDGHRVSLVLRDAHNTRVQMGKAATTIKIEGTKLVGDGLYADLLVQDYQTQEARVLSYAKAGPIPKKRKRLKRGRPR